MLMVPVVPSIRTYRHVRGAGGALYQDLPQGPRHVGGAGGALYQDLPQGPRHIGGAGGVFYQSEGL